MKNTHIVIAILTSIMITILFTGCLLSQASASISITNLGDNINISVDREEKYIATNDTKKWDFTWSDSRSPKDITLSCSGCSAKVISLENGDEKTLTLKP